MQNYVIVTDSGCDLTTDVLQQWGVSCISLIFKFDDEAQERGSYDMPVKEFYDKMRAGGTAKTSAISIGTFQERFEEILQQGKDVLYLGFSSGLSTTYHSACIAADQLREQYPQRKVLCVDTLTASAGQGLLVYLTMEKKNAGATVEEAAAFADEMKWNINHWVTVDDLVYLKRGGRVSPTVAFVGNALGIKPTIFVDNEGHLISGTKVRGRKKALAYLAEQYAQRAKTPSEGTVFISHSDCEEDAAYVAQLLQQHHGVQVQLTTFIGPVIGAHTGPGTVALFFVGNGR